jgi:hypothetical protein
MSFILKGFPKEIGEYIELPNIAELLMMPFFYDTYIDEAYKYGTDFQKELLNKVPLKGGKKTTSVLSQIRFLYPNVRCCTGYPKDPLHEWHIDSEENEYHENERKYQTETDIVHLLTNSVSPMTEFNKNDITINIPEDTSYLDFLNYFSKQLKNGNALNVAPEKMPSNQIVTFTNHIHRATNPTGYEFRYMFRVVETDRDRPAEKFRPEYQMSDIILPNNDKELNILKDKNKITIFFDSSLNYNIKEYSSNASKEERVLNLEIDRLGFESELIDSTNTEMIRFVPKNSIMLASKGNYDSDEDNRKLMELFENLDGAVTLVGNDGVIIESIMKKNFYTKDSKIGDACGLFILLNSQDLSMMKPNVKFKIVPRNNSSYKIYIPDDLMFLKK